MNNYEKIKSMSIDEMADFIDQLTHSGEYTCPYCKFYNDFYDNDDFEDEFCCDDNCIEGVKQWLQQECEEC